MLNRIPLQELKKPRLLSVVPNTNTANQLYRSWPTNLDSTRPYATQPPPLLDTSKFCKKMQKFLTIMEINPSTLKLSDPYTKNNIEMIKNILQQPPCHIPSNEISIATHPGPHKTDNEDCISVIHPPDIPEIKAIICTDGVSIGLPRTPFERNENGIAASNYINNQLGIWINSDAFKTIFYELINQDKSKYDRISKFFEDVTNAVQKIAKNIYPKNSSTTLELTFLVQYENQNYVFAFSWGDSSTFIYKNKITVPLNVYYYNNVTQLNTGYNIFFEKNFLNASIKSSDPEDPGAVINAHDAYRQKPSLTIMPINDGDTVIIATDGYIDNLSKTCPNDPSKILFQTDLAGKLITLCDELNIKDRASLIASVCGVIREKPDDITVAVVPPQ